MHQILRQLLLGLTSLLCLAPGGFAQTWKLDPNFAPRFINEESAALAVSILPMPDGRALAYGKFSHQGGTPTPGLVRLRSDGQIDPTFKPVLPEGTYAAAIALLAENKLLVVARAYSAPINGSASIVRLDSEGLPVPSLAPLETTGTISLTALPGGAVLAWGYFYFGDSSSTKIRQLARFKNDGSLDAAFAPDAQPGLVSPINCVVAQPDGRIVVSGGSASTTSVGSLQRLLADGTLDPSFNPPATPILSLLALQPDGKILTGYNPIVIPPMPVVIIPGFPAPLPAPANCQLARLLSNGQADPTFQPQISAPTAFLGLAALVLTLEPGAYTMQLTAAGTQSGEALVELYAIDP